MKEGISAKLIVFINCNCKMLIKNIVILIRGHAAIDNNSGLEDT